MKERLLRFLQPLKEFWTNQTKTKKMIFVSGALGIILLAAIATYFFSKETYVPLYSDLTAQEAGLIKEQLEAKGVSAIVGEDGKSILVPDNQASSLKVELAAEGYPDSGLIDYGFFGENASFGLTDNEFNLVKLESAQNELASLIETIDGITKAKVMITLPEASVWVSDDNGLASASIVLQTEAGYKFSEEQMKTLYKLVSKGIPNLPEENIVITDQYSNIIEAGNAGSNGNGTVYENQQAVKRSVERDIQLRVQQMLTTVMGPEKALVNVTADLDFKKENRVENIVTPVDEKENEGLAVSIERIKESYTGDKATAGGVTGTGETDIPNYQTSTEGSNGDYKKSEDRINYEFNRIQKEIEESPYQIRDLGIQVMVEPPNPDDINSLSAETKTDIQNILGTIVRTSIAKNETQPTLTEQEVNEKVYVSVQKFNNKEEKTVNEAFTLPWWVYLVAGILVLIILILVIIIFIKRRKNSEEIEEFEESKIIEDIPLETENEATIRRKQLEKLAKDNPADFVKILRSWISED